MNSIQEILTGLGELGDGGVEKTFQVGRHTYHVFAYPSLDRTGPRVRWKLYAVEAGTRSTLRGLTFGMADGVREALEDVVRSAEEHARTGTVDSRRHVRSFRPSPQD